MRFRRSGTTLLELLLALALATIVVAAAVQATYIHLRVLTRSREYVDRSMTNRAVLTRISKDLKLTLARREQDMSAIQAISSSQAGQAVRGATSLASGGAPSGQGASLGSATGQGASARSATSTGGPSDSNNSARSQNSSGSRGQSSQSQTRTNAGSTDRNGESDASDDESGSSSSSSGGTSLYGTSTEITIEISSLPVPSSYQTLDPRDALSAQELFPAPLSDRKTINYYVYGVVSQGYISGSGAAAVDSPITLVASGGATLGRGLYRYDYSTRDFLSMGMTGASGATGLEGRRSMTADASGYSGNDDEGLVSNDVVFLGFRYFNGEEWLGQWDSSESGDLPKAIEVTMIVDPETDDPAPAQPNSFSLLGQIPGLSASAQMERMIVHIPQSDVSESTDSSASEEDSASESDGGFTGANRGASNESQKGRAL